MLGLRKIAVTGGLASGKSSVCRILKDQGAYILSADEIVHQLLSHSSPLASKILALLGKDILTQGHFDRKKIANKVFPNKKLLSSLESLLHPKVLDEIERRYNQVKDDPQFSLFVVEIPLLYEIKGERLFDAIVAVLTDREIAIKRFQEKTKESPKQFDLRMQNQLSTEEKSVYAHFTIANNGSFNQLKNEVEHLYSQITQE